MAGQYKRLLEMRKFTASEVQRLDTTWGAGGYSTLEVFIRVLSPGSSGTEYVRLQHAPVNEDDWFTTLSSTQIALNTATVNNPVQVTSFSRFIRWQITGGSGDPIVSIDVVAKE